MRQVPQVPLSQELGTSWPAHASPPGWWSAGTSMTSPLEESFTLKAVSSARLASASLKASKWIEDEVQWPVIRALPHHLARTAAVQMRAVPLLDDRPEVERFGGSPSS